MSFWKRLSDGVRRLSLPSEPPEMRPGTERGKTQGGAKEGLWVERAKGGSTKVLYYAGGKKHGPFRDYYATGERRIEGTYCEGELDGDWRTWHDDGRPSGVATFERGKLEGMHRMYVRTGEVKLESEYVHNQPNGPWLLRRDDGAPHQEGAHDCGLRVGVWKLYDERGHLREEGPYDAGERDGLFSFYDVHEELVLETTWKAGVLDGKFRWLAQGSVLVEGTFREGVIEPGPRFAEGARMGLVAHPPPEPLVRGWVEIESALAVLRPPTELPRTFIDLGDDAAPLGDSEYAGQIESHEAWLTLFTDATKLDAKAREIVATRMGVRLRDRPGALLPEVGYPAWHHLVGTEVPHPLARFVTTISVDHVHFDDESSTRFRARFAKQLRSLSLFECTFDPSLDALLRDVRFEALEVLEIADYDSAGRGLEAVLHTDWARRLVRLAFDGTEARYEDAQLARVFENKALGALRSLSLGVAEIGPLAESAIARGEVCGHLEELHFVSCILPASSVRAIASNGVALSRWKIEHCTLDSDARAELEAWGEREGKRLLIV